MIIVLDVKLKIFVLILLKLSLRSFKNNEDSKRNFDFNDY